MPAQMILDKGRDEEIGVVVAFLHPQRERNARLPASLFQKLRLQLHLKETVGGALIDEKSANLRAALDQRAGSYVFQPSRFAPR